MPSIPSSTVIGKTEDGSDDVLVWWRDVGQARFLRISVMSRQFLATPATAERVCDFAGMTLSDLRKSLLPRYTRGNHVGQVGVSRYSFG
jgi:hypothetical protein